MIPALKRRALWGTLLATALVAGCDSAGSNGSGRVSLLMTDAPGDILAAVVTVSSVKLVGGQGQVTLLDTPYTTDLLTLAGTTATLATDVVVENGQYTELRFVITGAYIEVDNGDGTSSIYASAPDYAGLPAAASVAGELQMPSFGTSGLKVVLGSNSLDVDSDGHVILADFDAAQSFGQVGGNAGSWVMHPVILVSEVVAEVP